MFTKARQTSRIFITFSLIFNLKFDDYLSFLIAWATIVAIDSSVTL